ncbi:MAG: leucyl aminopeptidase [Deltaproteobacteria bacterium]|nr:leucyl aminopeptidase [Deltaproteobacteria bacterium]
MKIEVIKPKQNIAVDLLAVGLWKDWEKTARMISHLVDPKTNQWILNTLKKEKFKAKPGEQKLIPLNSNRSIQNLLIVGLGEVKDCENNLRRMAATTVRSATKIHAKEIAIEVDPILRGKSETPYQLITEGLLLGNYSFDLYKSKDNQTPKTVTRVLLLSQGKGSAKASKEIKTGEVLAEVTNYARDLINIPATDMTPRRMVEEAKKIGQLPRISCRILDQNACRRLGMGSFLAVASGSKQPPYLIHLHYRPSGRPKGRVAIVGKGITFDSGGLSIKPASGMETMKDDMSGAAAVLGLMKAISTLHLPLLEVHGIAAVTENMPSGSADKPGDVATTMIGKTIEILNTDAEGRLTLADALPYALRQKPDLVIDLATLTGAVIVALGDLCAGIMGTNQDLVDRLIASGQKTGEKLWQLPLIEEYKEDIKSSVADLKNVGAKGAAGTITAGLFLREFVDEKIPWAHVDIAGTAWTEKGTALCPRGGTGFMVRTLFHFLTHYHRPKSK